MELLAQIKKQVVEAMKAKNNLAKDVLRVAQGDIELAASRTGKPLTEAEQQQIVRKLIKSNQESLAAVQDANPAQSEKLTLEIKLLESLLPQQLSAAQIIAALEPVREDIKAAGNDGQATGVAMKHLRPQGLAVDGKDVAQAVKQIRAQ